MSASQTWWFALLLLSLGMKLSLGESDNIYRIVPSRSTNRTMKNTNFINRVLYEEDRYNESALPLISWDLTLLEHSIEMLEEGVCLDQCRLILASARNYSEWAVKFYDASAKLPVGMLVGSVYQLGNFDECVGIGFDDNADRDDTDDVAAAKALAIRGQYCLSEVHIDVPENYSEKSGFVWQSFRKTNDRNDKPSASKLYWGICVPSDCQPQDIERVLRRVLTVLFAESRLNVFARIPKESCFKEEQIRLDNASLIYVCVISAILSFAAAGTIFHVVYLSKKRDVPSGILPQVFMAFSVISNTKKIFGPAQNQDLRIDVISGIKLLSMLCVICGHTLLFAVNGPVLNILFWQEIITKVENAFFINNPLLVDTFLLLGGFLFCRILLRELDRKKSVNPLLLYIFRYIRLTPAYLVMIGLYVTWLPWLSSGPLWSRMRLEYERCLSSWWTNVLYINNYVDTDNLCMFQSWYLSVDSQLFVLAPAIIYPLWRWPKYGRYLLTGVLVISMAIPFAVTYINNLDPSLMIYATDVDDISSNEYFKNYYIKTHMRALVYYFGLLCGYVVYEIQKTDYRLSKKTVRFGWLFGTFSLLASMYSISLFYGPRKNFTIIEAAMYAVGHKVFWSIGIIWVLIACITDNSGPIRNFLKWRVFIAFSRLSYSAYLVNGLVVLYSLSTKRSPQYLSVSELISTILSHWMLTFIGAFILSILFEAPIFALEKILLKSI